MVSRPLSRYLDDKADIQWGVIAENDDEFPQKIRYVLQNPQLFSPRDYYIGKYSTAISMQKWGQLVKDLSL
jgi:hypothetical protein